MWKIQRREWCLKLFENSRDNAAELVSIRQAASAGIATEYYIRKLVREGRCPGVYSGWKFLVNLPLLKEQIRRESLENSQPKEDK